MNRLERAINLRLEGHPELKRSIKNIYQFAGSFVSRPDHLPRWPMTVRPSYFFGFHDLCPWSIDDTKLLAHRCDGVPHRVPHPSDQVEVGFFEGTDQTDFVALATTSAFNWQEGARLQWVGPHAQVIYNMMSSGRAVAERRDTSGQITARYDRPVCTVSPDGRYGSSYSYARVGRYERAYGYAGLNQDHEQLAPESDGLFLLDLKKGSADLIVPLAELARKAPTPTMNQAYHYVSHCLFSPDSARLSFMHCWLAKSRRWSRLFAIDLRTHALHLFPPQDWVSHHCWIDPNWIMAFATSAGGRRCYLALEFGSSRLEVVGAGTLTCDGHPQVSGDRRWLLTDTYPDGMRRQSLLLYDLHNARRHELLRLRIPMRYSHGLRCDFHPRWNRGFTALSFDSAHSGVRALCTLELREFGEGCQSPP